MRTVLVTGSDTGVGKTRVVGALARRLAGSGLRVQVVKVVETGAAPGEAGDASVAAGRAGASAHTLFSFPEALAPASAAAKAGKPLEWDAILAAVRRLPDCDWRIYEGAGGIASPLEAGGRDWADFAAEVDVEFVVVVIPDRLGAINQARLTYARAEGWKAGLWLNAAAPVLAEVAASNRAGLKAAGLPIWAEQAFDCEFPAAFPDWVDGPEDSKRAAAGGKDTDSSRESGLSLVERWQADLDDRDRRHLRRRLAVREPTPGILNLADNDYLNLARDPAVAAGAAEAARRWGASASASPLVTGWREPHEQLLGTLKAWHGLPHGLLWSSGYAANGAVLSTLPAAGDLVLADRLIHHSMIAGLLRSGARLQRYPHLDLDRLEAGLAAAGSGRSVFVATESVFSMDGDHPDLRRLAELKRRFGFFWVLDEAHGLGWYGPAGAGLAAEMGVADQVDVLIGTLGKTLASGGAYALFRDEAARERVLNHAGEFIYSTALPPPNAGAAEAALRRVRELAGEQARWRDFSRAFRTGLVADGWAVPEGDSPIVPIRLDREETALELAAFLRGEGIWVAAVRPPTVPVGTSRLRLSLKRTLTSADAVRVRTALARGRDRKR